MNVCDDQTNVTLYACRRFASQRLGEWVAFAGNAVHQQVPVARCGSNGGNAFDAASVRLVARCSYQGGEMFIREPYCHTACRRSAARGVWRADSGRLAHRNHLAPVLIIFAKVAAPTRARTPLRIPKQLRASAHLHPLWRSIQSNGYINASCERKAWCYAGAMPLTGTWPIKYPSRVGTTMVTA